MFCHQLNLRFDETGMPFVIMRRQELVKHLTINALEKKIKPPKIKPAVRNRMRAYGVAIRYRGGLIEFSKIEAKKNPSY